MVIKRENGFSFGTSYEQYENIFFSPELSNIMKIYQPIQKLQMLKKQDGDYLDLNINYALTLNKLNQNFNPSDGYKIRFSKNYQFISEDYTL